MGKWKQAERWVHAQLFPGLLSFPINFLESNFDHGTWVRFHGAGCDYEPVDH